MNLRPLASSQDGMVSSRLFCLEMRKSKVNVNYKRKEGERLIVKVKVLFLEILQDNRSVMAVVWNLCKSMFCN